jgi:uncharacterized membrane protein (Fun14 family)
MKREIAGVLVGLVAWFVVATAVNLVLRISWPDYAAAEKPMTFDFAMMLARLVTGAIASVCAGYAATWVAKGSALAARVLVVLLLLVFLPVHYALWNVFPAWYHLTFLASLIVLPPLGAMLRTKSRTENVPDAP